ncbi:MAG: DUF5985 family protein [Betaproteobacteria bacterium]
MLTIYFVMFLLAALTCLTCTVLLFRGYAASGSRLVFWTALCFVGLSLNNLLLFFDLAVFQDVPEIDLRIYRHVSALAGLACLIYGFIAESE